MSAKADLRHIIGQQLALLREMSARGPLSPDELAALQSLAKTAAVADGLEAGEQGDPEADTAALEAALAGDGG